MGYTSIFRTGVFLLALIGCKGSDRQGHTMDTVAVRPAEGGETRVEKPMGMPTALTLPDGTRVLMDPRTVIRPSEGFGKTNRDIQLDGEAMLIVRSDAGKPFIIHTRNLVIQVLGTRLHIDAFASSPGEEVDLLEGKLKVSKSYHSSTDNEVEVLQAGEMVMINRDIDLMEKEKLNPEEQKALEVKFPLSDAATPRS